MKRFWFAAVCALTLAIAGYCAYVCSLELFAVTNFETVIQKIISVIAVILCTFAALGIVIGLHELGHVLFGAIVKIKAVPKLRILGSSSCKIIPKTDKNLKPRIIFTTIGGLFVNFLFIIVGVLALFVPAVPVWLSLVLPASFYIWLLNLLPYDYDGGKTDGLVIYELIKNEDTAKVMLSVLTVQAQVLGGKPVEEVAENLLFEVPQIREDDINFIALTELRYEYFKAKGDEENAEIYRQRFESLKEYLPQ